MDKETKNYIDNKIDDLALLTKSGFDEVGERFEEVNKRFEAVDERFDQIETKIDTLKLELKTELKTELKEELMEEIDIRLASLRRDLMDGNERIIRMLSKKEMEDASIMIAHRRYDFALENHEERVKVLKKQGF